MSPWRGGRRLAQGLQARSSSVYGVTGSGESFPRPHRYPSPGGMGGVGSPSNGMAKESARIPRKLKTNSRSLLGRGGAKML